MTTTFKRCFLFFFLIAGYLSANENYDFVGRHFIASYLDCSESAIMDNNGIEQAMVKAINASGATLVDMADFEFSPAGYTMIALLSESHASIHTYPDQKACFVDLFTCGNRCSAEAFDAVMREYLAPKRVNVRFLLRSEVNQDQ